MTKKRNNRTNDLSENSCYNNGYNDGYNDISDEGFYDRDFDCDDGDWNDYDNF